MCNVRLNSRIQYFDHREGKKHKKKRVVAGEKKKLELTVAPYQ